MENVAFHVFETYVASKLSAVQQVCRVKIANHIDRRPEVDGEIIRIAMSLVIMINS